MPDVKERILARIDFGEVIELARSLVRIPGYPTDETCARVLGATIADVCG